MNETLACNKVVYAIVNVLNRHVCSRLGNIGHCFSREAGIVTTKLREQSVCQLHESADLSTQFTMRGQKSNLLSFFLQPSIRFFRVADPAIVRRSYSVWQLALVSEPEC
jgi:hypothetical protein